MLFFLWALTIFVCNLHQSVCEQSMGGLLGCWDYCIDIWPEGLKCSRFITLRFTSLLFWIWLSVSMKKSPLFLKSVVINLLDGDWLSPSCSLGQCCLYGEPKSSITGSLYSSKQSRLKIMFTQLLINCNSLLLNMNVLQILLCCDMLFEITHTQKLLILYISSSLVLPEFGQAT